MTDSLSIGIKVTTDAKQSVESFWALTKQLRESQMEFRAAQAKVSALAKEMSSAENPSKTLQKEFAAAQREVKALSSAVDRNRAAMRAAKADLAGAGVEVSRLVQEYARLRKEAASAASGMNTARLGTDASRAQSALDRLGQQGSAALVRIERQSTATTAGTDRLAGAVQRVGHYFATWQIANAAIGAGRELISTAADWDRLDATLSVTEGDARKALETLAWLKGVAKELGLELRPTVDSFAKLNASAKGTAMEGEPVREVFVGLVGAMTRMGAGSERIQLALDAVGQMISKVVVNADDLRQQLGDHLYGAMQHVARGMGMSVVQLNELMASGRLLTEDMLPKLARELNGAFGTGRIDTLTANLNRLATAWDQLKRTVADTAGIKGGVSWLAGQVERIMAEMAAGGSPRGKTLAELTEMHDTLVRLIDAQEQAWGARPLFYVRQLRAVDAELARLERRQKAIDAAQSMGPPKPPTLSDSESLFLESLKTSDQKAVEAVQAKINQLKAMRDKIVATLGEARYQALSADLDRQLAEALKKTEDKLGKGETRFDAQFAAAETRYRLPPGLLKAVADVETGGKFNPLAVSPAGALGLMQFMPATARRFGLEDPFNADAAIEAAGHYFRKLLDLFNGDLVKAIAAYNAGEGNVQRLGLDTVLSERFGKGETMRYVPKVLGKLEDYGNVTGYQDRVERDIKAAEERRKLAAETTQFEQQQREAQLDAARRADEMETARLEAAYRDRRIGASDYYAGLSRMQAEAVRREVTELAMQIQAEAALQRSRASGTEEYLKGQEKIFALERRIAAARDGATAKALDQGRALAEATRAQSQALSDQLNQLKLRLLEARRQGGSGLADTLIPPEQQEEFQARLQVLQDQYREFIAQLRQAGDAEGLALVNRAIRTEAVQGLQTETDRLSEFAVQGARNMQSAFADYLFDPFGQGLEGMARGFLDTIRRMAAEAASQMLLEQLLGKNFAGTGQGGGRTGELGGWIGAAAEWFRGPKPATPYPNVPAESPIQVGPVRPAEAATAKDSETLGTLVDEFGVKFEGLFNDGFFSGLGTLFRDGFSGIFGGLASMFGNLLNLMIGRGASYQSDGMKALNAAISVVGAVASAYGGGAAAGGANAAANAGSGNGLGAVNVSGGGSSWGSSFQSGVYHRGGLVGFGGER